MLELKFAEFQWKDLQSKIPTLPHFQLLLNTTTSKIINTDNDDKICLFRFFHLLLSQPLLFYNNSLMFSTVSNFTWKRKLESMKPSTSKSGFITILPNFLTQRLLSFLKNVDVKHFFFCNIHHTKCIIRIADQTITALYQSHPTLKNLICNSANNYCSFHEIVNKTDSILSTVIAVQSMTLRSNNVNVETAVNNDSINHPLPTDLLLYHYQVQLHKSYTLFQRNELLTQLTDKINKSFQKLFQYFNNSSYSIRKIFSIFTLFKIGFTDYSKSVQKHLANRHNRPSHQLSSMDIHAMNGIVSCHSSGTYSLQDHGIWHASQLMDLQGMNKMYRFLFCFFIAYC